MIDITRIPAASGGFHAFQSQPFPIPGELIGMNSERATVMVGRDNAPLLIIHHDRRGEFDVIAGPTIA